MNINEPRGLKSLMFGYKGKALIYGVHCRPAGKLYIGSTFSPTLRFHKHFVTGYRSNEFLQNDINQYGLESITVHIFEIANFESNSTYSSKRHTLRKLEQSYINQVPPKRLYNKIKAFR